MAFLTANNGPNAKKRYELDGGQGVYMLGRHPDCQIIVDVGAVSRYHAKITVDEKKQFYIEDNKSRNGTYLNDEILQRVTALKEGDQIRVCDVDFTFFHFEEAPTFHIEEAPPPLFVSNSFGDSEVQVCTNLRKSLEVNHQHYSDPAPWFYERLLQPQSRIKSVLGAGFDKVVVLDAAKCVGETRQFDLASFLRFAAGEMAREFGFEKHDGEYHPEEISQILKDEPRSLFVFLNIQLISIEDLLRLRGFTQEEHRSLYCGPHDFARREINKCVLVEDDLDIESGLDCVLDVSSQGGRLQYTASPQVKLDALIEITSSLGRALSLDSVLPGVLDSLFRIFVQADRGFIVLRDAQGKLIPFWTKVRRESAGDQHRISRTIVNQVMESKEAVLSADAASDERFEMSQSIADFRIRSMMCAPLLDTEGNAQGVLQVDTLDQRKRFQQGDLEVLASVATQSGIAIANARMLEETLRRRALERDLEVAHEVQKRFLPTKSPETKGYRFFDYYEPANHVGGDYFDYIALRDGRLAVIVADVVGHGIAAALMMAKVSAEAKFSLANEPAVDLAVNQLNDVMCGLNLDRFVTMIMVVIDPKTHEATIVNAGHMAPIWKKSTGEIEEPGANLRGLPIGINSGIHYQVQTIKLDVGDTLTLYTDGINESSDGNTMFGIDRLRALVNAGDSVPERLGEAIVSDVRQFLGDEAQEDDMCLICLGRDRPF